jgi:hypothetical protein
MLFEVVEWCGVGCGFFCFRGGLRAGRERNSTGVQYVTPNKKNYCEKVKMCRFSSGN